MSPNDIRELFSVFGPVEVHRMFGGAGIYADGIMFALVADGVIYLKADEQNTRDFERERLGPFTYATKAGRREIRSYRRMPDRLYDDPEELAIWARAAFAAAGRGQARPKPSAKGRARSKDRRRR